MLSVRERVIIVDDVDGVVMAVAVNPAAAEMIVEAFNRLEEL